MVAEAGGYRSSSVLNSRVGPLGSMNRSVGNYGSGNVSYADSSGTGAGSSAPIFGRIRITQSVERESRNGDSVGSFYVGSKGYTPKATSTVHGRRYSLSTDKIWPKDRTLDLSAASGARSSLQPTSIYGSRRTSLSSTTPKYSTANQRHYVPDESGNYTNSIYMERSDSNSHLDHRYGSSSSISGISSKRNARASSISSYDGHGLTARESSVSRYEALRGRSPSVTDYDNQSSLARASSVARYESYSSLGRSPSVSRYESQTSSARAPSLPRYESQNYLPRSPSVSTYESPSSVRASSVSRFDAGQPSLGKRFRSASVSRYEAPSSLSANDVDYQRARARSVARSEDHYERSSLSASVDSSAADDDSAYELRRQLRALRNQQIRAGSVTSNEKHEYVPHQHQEHHQVSRPRSLSTSSSTHRRYKVLKLHTPIQVVSPSNPPLITGYPEPTLYSAKVFRTLPGSSQDDKTADIAASSTELGFIDNREDITSFVLKPGEKFLPTDVSVNLLPSGRKAVTYTQFSQTGHGDQHAANAEIDRIIKKTKSLQESMHTLEDFVKRNRSLFPEDIIIYQKIIFYLLSEEELLRMGEKPDAEIYGVKIRERLVAPIGTDVASILKRFYTRHSEVDVEYEHPEVIRQQLKMTEAGGEIRIPNKGKRFDDDLDLDRARHVPHDWVPSRQSRSTDHDALYEDEDEMMRRDETRRTPKVQRSSAPEFTHRLRRLRAAVGQTIRFSCSVSACPEAGIKWYREKQEITDNGRFTAKNVSGLCTLSISDVTADDTGLYTAKASNSEGEATTFALLEVYDLRLNTAERPPASRKQPSSEPIAAPAGPAAPGPAAGGRRPFFLLEARNLWADVGERAVFEVQAAGKPLPSFTWIRDEDQLSEDDHIQIVCDGYGNCKLVIKEIRVTDFGTYRCLAQNEDGTVESIAALFGVGNESVRPGQALKNELRSSAGQHKGRRPQFVHAPPSRIDVSEGEALTLQCVVDGDPKPLVTWYKGVRELTYTGRHRVLEERNNCYVMQIKSTLATDSGEYTVTAHNLCGLVESIVCVNVLPGKLPFEDFDTNWKRPDITPLEYELVTRTRQGKMPPIFVKKLPREKQMKVGESLKLDCYVEETKPREYLVDVDVIVKDSKKEGPHPKNTEKNNYLSTENRISPKPNLQLESSKESSPSSVEPESNKETVSSSVEPDSIKEPESSSVEPESIKEPESSSVEPDSIKEPESSPVEPDSIKEPESSSVEPDSIKELLPSSVAGSLEQSENAEQEMVGTATDSLLDQKSKEAIERQEDQILRSLGSEGQATISNEIVGQADDQSPVNKDAVVTVEIEPDSLDQLHSETVTVQPVATETTRTSDRKCEELESPVTKDSETLQSHSAAPEPTIAVKAAEKAQDTKNEEEEEEDKSSSESQLSSSESEEEP